MSGTVKKLWELFSIFFKIGLCTFGGGIAMLPVLDLEIVKRRNWASSEELLDWFAVAQSTPGIIAVNVATFTGYKRAGVLGGCVATFAIVLPSILIITLLALFLNNFSEIVWVQKAMKGINVAVAAILVSAVFNFSKKSVKNAFGVVLFAVSFVLIYFFNVGTVWVIIGSCVIGIVIAGFQGKLKETPTAEVENEKEAEKND